MPTSNFTETTINPFTPPILVNAGKMPLFQASLNSSLKVEGTIMLPIATLTLYHKGTPGTGVTWWVKQHL